MPTRVRPGLNTRTQHATEFGTRSQLLLPPYTDTWREAYNVPDSDPIEAPAVFELEGRDSRRKRGTSDVSQA